MDDLTDPTSLGAGDFNDDGFVDLVAVDRHPVVGVQYQRRPEIALFVGDGAGGFLRSQRAYIRGGRTAAVDTLAIGDFNADGHADFASIDDRYDRAHVHLGNGIGAFLPASPAGTPVSNPMAVAAGRFDADMRDDLAIARSGEVEVFTSAPTGDAGPKLELALGTFLPTEMLFEDIDGDNLDDLIIAGGNRVLVLRRSTTGAAFEPAIEHVIPNATIVRAIAAAEIDGDGNRDLVLLIDDASTPSVRWLRGQGTGAFVHSSLRSWWVPPDSFDLALGDVNGDQILDVVTSHESSSGVPDIYVRLGTGLDASTMFGDPQPGQGRALNHVDPGFLASGVQVIDADSDGDLDIVVGTKNRRSLRWFENDGQASFSSTISHSLSTSSDDIHSLAQGDLNADGRPDLVVLGGNTTTSIEEDYRWSFASVLLSNAIGLRNTRPAHVTKAEARDTPWDLLVRDFDGDGHHDVVTSLDLGDRVALARTHGLGPPLSSSVGSVVDSPRLLVGANLCQGPLPEIIAIGDSQIGVIETIAGHPDEVDTIDEASVAAAVGDVDGDGAWDLITLTDTGDAPGDEALSIRLATGPLSFGPATVISLSPIVGGRNPRRVESADLDDDGYADLAIAFSNGSVELRLSDGAGGSVSSYSVMVSGEPSALSLSDVDQDGHIDVLVGSDAMIENVRVYFGDGLGGIDATRAPVVATVPGAPSRLVVADFNGDCSSDLAVSTVDALGPTGDGVHVLLARP